MKKSLIVHLATLRYGNLITIKSVTIEKKYSLNETEIKDDFYIYNEMRTNVFFKIVQL